MDWQFSDAKNRFSELMNRALSEGPQRVRRRKDEVVMISAEEYDRLTGRKPGLKAFLTQPLGLDDIDLTRDTSPMRDAGL